MQSPRKVGENKLRVNIFTPFESILAIFSKFKEKNGGSGANLVRKKLFQPKMVKIADFGVKTLPKITLRGTE